MNYEKSISDYTPLPWWQQLMGAGGEQIVSDIMRGNSPAGTKPQSLAALSIPLPLLALLLSVLQAGCDNDEGAIRVRVHYAGTAPAPALSNLVLIAGDDKFAWPTLENGGTETVTLHADPRSERELVLLYTLDGQAKSWDGPRFGPGHQGYRIHLEIDGDGRISSRHCRLPCALDPPPTP